MNDSYQASGLWKSINSAVEDDARNIDLGSFRHPGAFNNRLASWDPEGHSVRYYKTILFNMGVTLSDRELEILDRISNRNTGAPVTIKARGRYVCLDYLLAVNECSFIESQCDVSSLNAVLEIGCGFGRTAHALLSNYNAIECYTIIDLGVCLELAERYLQQVLPDHLFSKIKFVHVNQVGSLDSARFDLAINIDSMAEMGATVVRNYLAFIKDHCRGFYCKNPVGKYSPESVGIQINNVSEYQLALKMGLMTNLIDIFDDQAIELEVDSFLSLYVPGDSWNVVAHSAAQPWQYYHQVFFNDGSSCASG